MLPERGTAMLERNTVVGVDFLVVGGIVAGLGYVLAQSVPIAAFGFAVLVIGALILLIVPEAVPQDAYRAMLSDAIRNVEIILEESGLRERAYFMQMDDGEVRALIPLTGTTLTSTEISELQKSPRRFVVNHKGILGLMLIPPGNQVVMLAKVEKGADLEESLRAALVDASDLASSVISVEEAESRTIKVQISKPKITSESPYFNECLGTPVSSMACCVATVAKGQPVRILDEKYDPALVRLTMEVVQ
jgi:hypothetical protein